MKQRNSKAVATNFRTEATWFGEREALEDGKSRMEDENGGLKIEDRELRGIALICFLSYLRRQLPKLFAETFCEIREVIKSYLESDF